jgi:hypothetical protein
MPWIHRERMQSSFKDEQVKTHGPQNHGKYENMMATLFDVVSGSVHSSVEPSIGGRSPFASGSNYDVFESQSPSAQNPDNYLTASVYTEA